MRPMNAHECPSGTSGPSHPEPRSAAPAAGALASPPALVCSASLLYALLPMPASVRVAAPAKLNLALSVGPPNVDRMHPISSWMVTVDLFDDLDVARLPDGSLSRYAIEWHPEARRRTPIDWSISKDLAVRAHLAIERLVGRPLPLQMRLRKRIPVGGGLGGGSSDAAAMIRAVDAIFDSASIAMRPTRSHRASGRTSPSFLKAAARSSRASATASSGSSVCRTSMRFWPSPRSPARPDPSTKGSTVSRTPASIRNGFA